MNLCKCDHPLPDQDDLSCVLCGRSSAAAIPIDALDTELQRRRRNGYRLEERPLTDDEIARSTATAMRLAKADIDGVVERPEDCSDENCWRHGGKGSCRCDDETEGGVWQPGC